MSWHEDLWLEVLEEFASFTSMAFSVLRPRKRSRESQAPYPWTRREAIERWTRIRSMQLQRLKAAEARRCRVCGKDISAKRRDAVFCGRACEDKERRSRAPKKPARVCPFCRTPQADLDSHLRAAH